MDLSSPLSSLIPSMDAAALEVLVRTQTGLRVSKIRQLSRRGSRQGIANALERLVEHGLVDAEPTNFGFTYRLNRNHILATVCSRRLMPVTSCSAGSVSSARSSIRNPCPQ